MNFVFKKCVMIFLIILSFFFHFPLCLGVLASDLNFVFIRKLVDEEDDASYNDNYYESEGKTMM